MSEEPFLRLSEANEERLSSESKMPSPASPEFNDKPKFLIKIKTGLPQITCSICHVTLENA